MPTGTEMAQLEQQQQVINALRKQLTQQQLEASAQQMAALAFNCSTPGRKKRRTDQGGDMQDVERLSVSIDALSLARTSQREGTSLSEQLEAAAAELKLEQGQREASEVRLREVTKQLREQERTVAELLEAQERCQTQQQKQHKQQERHALARLQQAEQAAQQERARGHAQIEELQQLRGTPEALAACDFAALGSLQRVAQKGLAAIQAALQERLEADVRMRAASSPWSTLTAEGVADEAAVRSFFARRQQCATADQRLRIASMVKVENQHTLGRFSSAKSFHINPLDAHRGRGDTLLFHGCPDTVAANIQASGLLLSHAGNGMLGAGLYGAPDPQKSLGYCRSQDKFMFICRFNLSGAKHAGPATKHRNTVYDEFCVYDERHVVVLWMLKLK